MKMERHYQVLLEPCFTEKSTQASEASNQVVFKVARDATKTEIARAVQSIFEVDVKRVNVVNIRGKTGRNRNGVFRRSATRKAYVLLEQNAEINFSKY